MALGVAARGRGRRVRGGADRPGGALAPPAGRAAGRTGTAPARAAVGRTRERPGRGGRARSRGPRRPEPLRVAAGRRAGRRCRRRRAGANGSIVSRRWRRARCGTPCACSAARRPAPDGSRRSGHARRGAARAAAAPGAARSRSAEVRASAASSSATPDALRGRTFRVVFVVGLAERVFPQRSREDPLLLDDMRRALAAPLAVEDDRVHGERVRLRLAVGAATERCWLSYPRLDVGQGRARVPSFYALDVMRASPARSPITSASSTTPRIATGAWLAWPAPDDPGSAIDVWEHDLAVLGRLLRPSPEAAAKGAAHYLLELNPRAGAVAAHAVGAVEEDVVAVGRPDRRPRRGPGAAGRAAPDGPAVLRVGAAALLGVPVPVPARRDLPVPAARAARGDRPARSADARRHLP